ncbi:MAG: thioester reductase, partial [Jatrophihabitantaceae bacterium]
ARTHIALFVVGAAGLTEREVRRWLAQRLPPPMRPARVLIEAALPRNTSGKLDRVRLAAR